MHPDDNPFTPPASEHNPFAPPQTDARPGDFTGAVDREAEAIRRRFLNHESSVKTIGWLYLIGGTLTMLGAIGLIVLPFAAADAFPATPDGLVMIIGAIYLGVSVLILWIGNGLRTLGNAARIGGIVFSSLAMICSTFALQIIPVLIQVLFLYYLASDKGRYVCSAEYHEIVRQTPHIKRRSWILIVFLVFIGMAIVSFIALPIVIGLTV